MDKFRIELTDEGNEGRVSFDIRADYYIHAEQFATVLADMMPTSECWSSERKRFVGTEWYVSVEELRPLDWDKNLKKVVDMTKFANTDFLLVNRMHDNLVIAHPSVGLDALNHLQPKYWFRNYWTGTKKPDFLKGFKYQVVLKDNLNGTLMSDINWQDWGRVIVIIITGLEEGWEYPE